VGKVGYEKERGDEVDGEIVAMNSLRSIHPRFNLWVE
jgi:hypothetical protein